MKSQTMTKQDEEISPLQERERLAQWPRIGIRLEKVMAQAGQMEDVARLLREDEGYAGSYTIEEQIQRASDRLRTSIRAFEKNHRVKVEIFTAFSPFADYTDEFLPHIQKPGEMS